MKSNTSPKPKRTAIIKTAINNMLKMFKSGNFPQSVAMSIIRKHEGDTIPSDNWTLGNQCKVLKMQEGLDNGSKLIVQSRKNQRQSTYLAL